MLPSSRDILAAGTLDIGRDRIATILHTIRRGWSTVRKQPEVSAGTPEIELNVWLRKGMTGAVEPRNRGSGPKMLVSMGTETLSSESIGAPDGRVDIAIFFPAILEARNDHDPHAIIECKRVAGTDSGLCREYVIEGIDRFVSGKYGRRHAVGFMAGYLESGTTDLSVRGINRYLDGQGRPAEHLGPAVTLDADWARSSRHPRLRNAMPLELHHAFLAFA